MSMNDEIKSQAYKCDAALKGVTDEDRRVEIIELHMFRLLATTEKI